jgi:prepilin-type N-terminal cleavage/methylation domain-containing protein
MSKVPLKTSTGFTMVELLCGLAVVAMLVALGVGALGAAQKSGMKASEIAAGKTLMLGYHLYATENGGSLLPGYVSNPGEVQGAHGEPLTGQPASRYPWRLAPYLSHNYKAAFLATKQKIANPSELTYLVSLVPSLGVNGVYVGGDESSPMNPFNPRAAARYGDFCVLRLNQSVKPSQLIVFASASYHDVRIGGKQLGYFKIEYPDKNVDFRYNGKAVVACLDGHVELLTREEMRDMRRWSNLHAQSDDPNFAGR